MIFLKVWNFFRGYLTIRAEGLSLEKFINLCVSNNIKLWGIKRTGYTSLKANIRVKDFKFLPPIVRIVHTRIKIVDKRGLPFLIHRFRHRKMLLTGLVVFVVLIYVLSSFIWQIELVGTIKVDPELIYSKLEEKGIKLGVYKGKIKTWDIENEILIEIPDLSWISVELKGTKAIIKVVEGVKAPELIDTQTPCNIVAFRDGIIHELLVLDGDALVKAGDTVTKGQLLVSGIIHHEETQVIRYIHARAKAFARVWYEGRGQGNFADIRGIKTGEKVTERVLETKNWEIGKAKKEIPFKHYKLEERMEPIFGLQGIKCISWLVRDYYEIEVPDKGKMIEDTKAKAAENAMEDALNKMPEGVKIIDKMFKYDIIKDKGYRATVYLEVLEDIAQPMAFSTN